MNANTKVAKKPSGIYPRYELDTLIPLVPQGWDSKEAANDFLKACQTLAGIGVLDVTDNIFTVTELTFQENQNVSVSVVMKNKAGKVIGVSVPLVESTDYKVGEVYKLSLTKVG